MPTATLAADETTLCEGSSTTLTATVTNTDSIFWYADGIELIAERGKTNITVSPTATATYKVKTMNTDTVSDVFVKGAAATTSQIAVGDIVTTDNLLVKPADWAIASAAPYNKTALGVVYHVSDTLTRIVTLNENASVPWGFNVTDIPGVPSYTQAAAEADFSGQSNTAAILAYNTSSGTNLNASQCAAVWAAGQDGYLPACGELKTVMNNINTVNNTLYTISGTQISNDRFWSSSEYFSEFAWSVYYSGLVYFGTKGGSRRARAVVALSTVYLFNNLTISCEAEAEQTVYVGTLPTISLAADETTLCEGSSTTLTATVTNTDSIFWYADGTELIAERGKTNITVSPTATATYKVKAMNTDIIYKGAVATTSQIAVGDIVTTDNLLVKPADWAIASAAPYNKTALGVVYHVSDTLTRIVTLNENASVPWGFNVTDIPGVPSYTQAAAEADFSGQSNTAAILAYNTSSGTNLNASQCAAVWAAGQDGYLPACGELKTVMNNINTVNNTLYTISGTQISNDRFWSSSEYFSEFAWSVYYSGLVYFGTKGGSRRARAVVALSTVYLFNNLTISCEAEAEQTITVHPVFDMPTVVDTVCFAENYTEYGWSINTADSIADTYLYERKEQTIHGCDSIVNLQLTIIPEVIVNPTYDITVCNGALISTTFTTSTIGNGTMIYAWTNDNTSIGLAASGEGDIASFTATNTGIAPVTATIEVTPYFTYNGVECSGEAKSFTITVNYNPVIIASVVTTASCSTGADGVATVTVLNGVSEYSYSWNTNPVQTTQTAVNLPVGMHSVTVTDANGCSTTTTVE
ncbi:MAG: hypothetical protein PHU62_10505, partial [Bacteroidales bacterium]|nr:hypothetical protein [Bacteroidales bacterium]